MEETKPATEANAPTIASGGKVTVSTDDTEARLTALEAEKAQILEREANYKAAYLKEVEKHKNLGDEDEDEKINRKVAEALANSRLAEIAREQDALLKTALKENKELKLAQLNKTTVPAAMGTHSESQPVTDTLITPEQMAFFKSKGWDDKTIERYKQNLRKNMR